PAELPHDDHLLRCDHRCARCDVRRHAGDGFFHQPAHAIRIGARDRDGGRRCDRRGGERRAQHGAASSRDQGSDDPFDGRNRELTIKRMAIALALLAVFLFGIYHLFTVLPTSFVPQEDQGYAFAAIIMPQSASLDRTQAIAEKVDAIFAKIPGVDARAMITGYSLLDGGFKPNAGTFFVTFKDFDERYKTENARTQNARAILV